MVAILMASALIVDAPSGRECGPPPRGNRPWVSDADYPKEARKQGMRGEVQFTLDVSPDGCATRCTVVKSSGYEILDRQTCVLMIVRARFAMEKDEAGNPKAGQVTKIMRWK